MKRLPRGELESRVMDVLWAREDAAYASSPINYEIGAEGWLHPLGEIGSAALSAELGDQGFQQGAVVEAAKVAARRFRCGTLALDLLCAAQRMGSEGSILDCRGLDISAGECMLLDIEEYPVCNLTLDSCLIRTLRLPRSIPSGVNFSSCVVGRAEGIASREVLPTWAQVDCNLYDNVGTTSGIMGLDRPLAVRVALTVLKKVYIQSGSGRKESALFRGLDGKARSIVVPVLEALRAEDLILFRVHKGENFWHPDRKAIPRIQRLITLLGPDDDPLMARLERLVN